MSGLEVVGSIASVLQLAQVVYEISKSLYEVGNTLANASSDILDLAHDLEIFSEELHLHATLVNAANHRYSHQVHRLTAKIIGRCATICGKIDRILKKLRTGGIYAKIRWLYKEKEIRKLLERVRDLKLSLLGTLSHLRSLEADHMMDALGYASSSMLKGAQDEEISKEAMADIEETRRKLMTLPMSIDFPGSVHHKFQGNATTCASAGTTLDGSRNLQAQKIQFDSTSLANPSTQLCSVVPPSSDANRVKSGFSVPAVSDNLLFGNPKALESAESFYSALSHPVYHCNGLSDIPPLKSPDDTPIDPMILQVGSCLSKGPHAGLYNVPQEETNCELTVPKSPGKYPMGASPFSGFTGMPSRARVRTANSHYSIRNRQREDDLRLLSTVSSSHGGAIFVGSVPGDMPQNFSNEDPNDAPIANRLSHTSPARASGPWTQSVDGNEYIPNEFLLEFKPFPYEPKKEVKYDDADDDRIKKNLSNDRLPSPSIWVPFDPGDIVEDNSYLGNETSLDLEFSGNDFDDGSSKIRGKANVSQDYSDTRNAADRTTSDDIEFHSNTILEMGMEVLSAPMSNRGLDVAGQGIISGTGNQQCLHGDDSRNARGNQLWWRAFIKMQKDDSTHYGALVAACHDFFSNKRPSEDANMARAEAVNMQNELRRVESKYDPLETHALDGAMRSFDQVLEILDVVQTTVGFQTGALAWMCLCAAIKGHLNTKQGAAIAEHEAMFSAFVDIATLIARYTVMENMYQNWLGMSLEPKYEDSLMSLCIKVLNFLEKILRGEDNQDAAAWSVAEEIAKINEADAVCRGFKVTILQEQTISLVDEDSEEDDSDGTLEELPFTKRTVEDLYAADSDSDSTEVGRSQKEVPIEGFSSSKRVKA